MYSIISYLPIGLFAILMVSVGGAVAHGQTSSESADFEGSWMGIITQVDGSTIRYFDMELTVSPEIGSDSTYSVSTHVMDGKYHAYIVGEAMKGSEDQLLIAESEIIRSDSIPGMEWCVKRYELKKEMKDGELHLLGVWGGDTSFGECIPGDMDLVRQVIRP